MDNQFFKNKKSQLRTLILLIVLIAAIVIIKAGIKGTESPTNNLIKSKLEREADVLSRRHLDLPDPNEAPNSIRILAEKGFRIMIDTKTLAKEYVGAKLDCTNCHFAAGDTTGGAQGSISLAGVAAKYPAFDKRIGKVIDLPARINNCFKRSMNGHLLPLDSDIMLALVTYLHWISSDIMIYQDVPWLGLEPLKIEVPGDPKKGKDVYHTYCALCHLENGEGTKHNPPLWGENSFNDAAGLNRIDDLAAFIYWNMPYNDSTPVLTEEEAFDVAAYIISKPRPHLK